MRPNPQFTARLDFDFRERRGPFPPRFVFDKSCHRRVPMQMDGVDGLHTVGMWVDAPGKFLAGDSVVVQCVLLAPELFERSLKSGVHFKLWESGFIAAGTILARCDDGWPQRRVAPTDAANDTTSTMAGRTDIPPQSWPQRMHSAVPDYGTYTETQPDKS